MKKWFTYNLPLKLIALGLAIITWIYVSREIQSRQMPDAGHQREAY